MIDRIKNTIRFLCRKLVYLGSPIGSQHNYEVSEHQTHFHRCFTFLAANRVDGDIAEFGVASGNSLILINRAAHKNFRRADYRIFGFDSFEGLPEAKGMDRDIHVGENVDGADFNKGKFACAREKVHATLHKTLTDCKHIELIEGWYDQVLTADLASRYGLKKLCFINIDCDFYESTKVVLQWCKPFISQGTIISFDDWFCYRASDKHGEMLAFKEFLKENNNLSAIAFSQYSWHGQAFIMQCNETTAESQGTYV